MIHRIEAKIKRVKYKATLCDQLPEYSIRDLEDALEKGAFILSLQNGNKLAVSRWVSPKRTRSYPYGRVYNTINFKPRVTIIPVYKDEGKFGDRDFIQWDTISMMSLLGVHVIIGHYESAQRNLRNPNKPKITDQSFDVEYIKRKIDDLNTYQSDALHWNMDQLRNIGEIGEMAIKAYERIGKELGIPMHSQAGARQKIDEISLSSQAFMKSSRKHAAAAAEREIKTVQPKEKIKGDKATITITNFLGGEYHLTADEVRLIDPETIQIVEAKHTSDSNKFITSLNDIKDAVFKMILFTNLEEVTIDGKGCKHESVVKLTSTSGFNLKKLSDDEKELYRRLKSEAETNGFIVVHK
jgi:hypothetical protein